MDIDMGYIYRNLDSFIEKLKELKIKIQENNIGIKERQEIRILNEIMKTYSEKNSHHVNDGKILEDFYMKSLDIYPKLMEDRVCPLSLTSSSE